MTDLYSPAIEVDGAEEPEVAISPEDSKMPGGTDRELLGVINASAELQNFEDHFSLPTSSSTVRFRKTQTLNRIYPSADSQFVIRDDYDENTGARQVLTMKLSDTTASLKALRLTYTLVCAFFVSDRARYPLRFIG